MSEKMAPDTVCQNCGRTSQEHWLTNYADGPHVGINILVCPSAVFKLQREPAPGRRER
jgi:hypothetical protein